MDVRSLRRKRIAIILAILVALVGGIGVVYVVQKKQSAARTAAFRAEGMAAFEAAEYNRAIEQLKPYCEANIVDAEAWYTFAQASLHAAGEDDRNIGEALRALRHVVNTLQYDSLDAQHDLLDLETLIEQNDRALELAQSILKQHPDDQDALRVRVLTLARLNRGQEAMTFAEDLIKQHPEDLEIQLVVAQLRFSLNQDPAAIIADARALVDAHPDDPRYELLLGTVLGIAGQQTEGLAHLRAAAARPMPSDVPLAAVIHLYDQTSLFNESLQVLVEQVKPDAERALVHEKIARCFEAGLFDVVESTIGDTDVTSPKADLDTATIAAMAAIHLDKPDRAAAIVTGLRARQSEQAAAWADVLDRLIKTQLSVDTEDIKLLRNATKLNPGSAYLFTLLGDALADANEDALAADAWRTAASLRPVWDAPQRQLARHALNTGQFEDAVRFAEAAYLRRPNNAENAITYVQVQAATIKRGDDVALANLLEQLDEIDRVLQTPVRTIQLRAQTLAQLGEIDAVHKLLSRVVDEKLELPDSLLAQLVALSREYELDTTDALTAMLTGDAGPQTVLNEALRLVADDKADEAIKYVDANRVADNADWDFVRARVLDATADPSAADNWKQLTARYADDARMQVAALRSDALAEDKPAADQIVARLRRLGGEDGTVWRVEQARWMLRNNMDATAALDLLRTALNKNPADLDAHLLCATAYQRTGRSTLAVRELQTAITQRPDQLGIRLELASIFQQMRSYELAAEQLNAVAVNPAASPAMLRRAALLLAQQGADLRAIALLEELMHRGGETGAVDNLLLASLYRRNGQIEKAEEACQRLLDKPTPSGVLFVAGVYATLGRGAEARQVLDKLDQTNATADEIAATRASYYSRFGLPDEALPYYRAAVEAAPNNREHWRRLIAFELTVGEVDSALDAARRGLKALKDDHALSTLVANAALVRRFAVVDRWRMLAISIVSDPEGGDVAVAALKGLENVPEEPAAQAAALRKLVDDHVENLPLQLAQVRAWMDAGDNAMASELANRAMYAHPQSVDAAWLAAEALSAQQMWPEALVAASQWRQRSAGQSMNADLIIAEAKLRLNDTQAAMREITPHLKAALADPRHYPAVIYSYVRILVQDNRIDEAKSVLQPMLDVDATWRQLWGRIAAFALVHDDPAKAAAWLTELEPHVPADAAAEQEELAQSWWSLFLVTNDGKYRAAALAWIDRVIQSPQPDANAWVLKGIICEISGELARAEEAYRNALDLDASKHTAANNLAMVIVRNGGDINDAIRLAQSAVDALPKNPDYLDTLAQVYAKAGQYDPAIKAMQRAIDVDPGRPVWQWNLLDLYEAAGKESEANRLRDQLKLQYPLGRPAESVSAAD